MNALLFFLFIAVGIALLAYFLCRTSASRRTELARKTRAARAAQKGRIEQLTTAGTNRLADKDAVWQARKRHVTMGSESTEGAAGQRNFAYKPAVEPEYDGYSRADRYHLTPASIKPEGKIDDIVIPNRPRPAPDHSPTPKVNH